MIFTNCINIYWERQKLRGLYMKIGIIIGSLGFGGAERVTVILSDYWSKHGHSVSIFTTMRRPENEYIVVESIKRIECFSGTKGATIKCLRSNLIKTPQDIVLIMDTPMCAMAVPSLIGLKIPFVVSERSSPATKAIKRSTKIVSHLLMNLASGFVFQTNEAKNYYNRKIQSRSTIIANPLKVEELPTPYFGERERRVVAVGRLIPAKNYPNLIHAFLKFHEDNDDYRLEIYGDGVLKKELTKMINEYNASQFIKLMGSRKSVLEDIKTAAIYVLSSDIEGMPNALIEAMAMGIPCIATDCPSGGSKDLIQDGMNGLLAPVRNSDVLANSLSRYVEDDNLSRMVSMNSIKVRDKLDINIIGEKWIRYFESIVHREGKNNEKHRIK